MSSPDRVTATRIRHVTQSPPAQRMVAIVATRPEPIASHIKPVVAVRMTVVATYSRPAADGVADQGGGEGRLIASGWRYDGEASVEDVLLSDYGGRCGRLVTYRELMAGRCESHGRVVVCDWTTDRDEDVLFTAHAEACACVQDTLNAELRDRIAAAPDSPAAAMLRSLMTRPCDQPRTP